MSDEQYVDSVQELGARTQYQRFHQKAALNRANVADSADDAALYSRRRRL
jgi:hypothetical protein